MTIIEVGDLPADPLAAASAFHRDRLSPVRDALFAGRDVALILPFADHTHTEWRRSAVAMLARAHAPRRVNMVAGGAGAAVPIVAYLEQAPGVTGQYLPAHGGPRI